MRLDKSILGIGEELGKAMLRALSVKVGKYSGRPIELPSHEWRKLKTMTDDAG